MGIAKHIALAWGAAVRGIHVTDVGKRRQRRDIALPVVGNEFGDRKPVTRITDGRCQQVFHRQPAETPVQFKPAVHTARHGDGQWSVGRDARQVPPPELIKGQAFGRPPAGVESVQALCFGVPDQRKQVAADATAGWFNHAEHGIGGNGGIHGRAAPFENFDGHLRRQRLTGAGHAVARNDL